MSIEKSNKQIILNHIIIEKITTYEANKSY